ncbi:hypothetical protein ACI3QN_13615, partial [Propionibacterium freudenreichii]|uniref:hypothetical protein n=1 Tax=Propionibacterium freudenreichii TaxID=1744 RepID=UPI0038529929
DAEATAKYAESWGQLTNDVRAARAKMDAERPFTVPYNEAKREVDAIEERMDTVHREMVSDTVNRNTPRVNQMIMERDGI